MTAATTNVDRVRAAYEAWNDTKGASRALWRELVSDDFEMQSVGARHEGLSFAGTSTGPDRLDQYLRELIEQWDMKHYRVDALFGDETRVVMFGECSYDFRGNGKRVTTPIANLWTFRDGKAIRCVEVFDSAEAVRVASL
jgi:ketosteroid isomerase-like protein